MGFLEKMALAAGLNSLANIERNTAVTARSAAAMNSPDYQAQLDALIAQVNHAFKASGCDAEYGNVFVFGLADYTDEVIKLTEMKTYMLEYLCLGGKPEIVQGYFAGPERAKKYYASALFLKEQHAMDRQDEYSVYMSDPEDLIGIYNIDNDTHFDPEDYYTG
ncbi:MAG: hypothetical protein Q4E57_08755 [Eubacteriales bacterium]|nr:hypothetical protein [Eubacteriales bacterium]